MSKGWPMVALGEVIQPIERDEVPIPGTIFCQVGISFYALSQENCNICPGE